MPFMFVAALVFQPVMSLLNSVEPANMFEKLVTRLTSQLLISRLKLGLLAKADDRLVTAYGRAGKRSRCVAPLKAPERSLTPDSPQPFTLRMQFAPV